MIINYSDFKKIQSMKESGYNPRQTFTKLGFTSYSVYKFWNMTEQEFIDYNKLQNEKLDKFKDFILEELQKNPTIRNSTILDHIRNEFGWTSVEVSDSSYYRYMKRLRNDYGYNQKNETRIYRMESDKKPAEEAEVDLASITLKNTIGGYTKVYFFVMVLNYSRMKFVYFSNSPFTSKLFCYAHDLAFRYFSGYPKTIRYDQDVVMVASENAGDIAFTKEFDKYKEEVGFNVYLCKKSDSDSKGMVENVVKFVKTSFLDSKEYSGIDSLNAECLKWLDRTGNGIPSKATYHIPRDVFKEEVKYLNKYTHEKVILHEYRIVTVSPLNEFVYKKNHYSIPVGHYKAKDRLRVEEKDDNLLVFDIETNEVVITHKLVKNKIGTHVTLEKEFVVPKVFQDMVEEYKGVSSVTFFLNNMIKDKPRYASEQCFLLKKIFKQYEKEDVYFAIRECNTEHKTSVTDVLALLIVKYGMVRATSVMPPKSTKLYKDKATILAKYDLILRGE